MSHEMVFLVIGAQIILPAVGLNAPDMRLSASCLAVRAELTADGWPLVRGPID